MHVHLGIVEAIKIFLYVIIAGFFWRLGTLIMANQGHDKVASAMSMLY